MLVAVVLSETGNQRLEMKAGAAMMVTPDTPLRMAQTWLVARNTVLSSVRRGDRRNTVPRATRPDTRTTVTRKPFAWNVAQSGGQKMGIIPAIDNGNNFSDKTAIYGFYTSINQERGTTDKQNMMVPQLANIATVESGQ